MRLDKKTSATVIITIILGLFTLAFNWFNPPVYLYIVFFGLAFLFIARYPLGGFLAAIFLTLVFGQQFALQPLVIETTSYLLYPLDITLILTIIGAILQRKNWWPQVKKSWRWLTPLLSFFIIIMAANLIWSAYAGSDLNLAFSAFKNYAVYSLIFVLAVVLLRSTKDLRHLLKTILFAGLAAGVILLINIVRGQGFLVEFTPISTAGTRYLSGVHAWGLALAIIVSLAFFAYQKKVWRHFQVPIVLAQIVGMGVSLFRHLWLVLVMIGAAVLAWLPQMLKRRFINFIGRFLMIIAIAGLFVFYISAFIPNFSLNIATEDYLQPFVERVTTFSLNPEDESAQFRLKSWGAAWNSFTENPIFGAGLDAKLNIEVNDFRQTIDARDVHNSFLTILVETGLLGLAPLVLLIILAITNGRRALKQINKKPHYLLAFLLGFVAFVAAANFGVYFETNITVIFFWIFLAGMFATVHLLSEDDAEKQPAKETA